MHGLEYPLEGGESVSQLLCGVRLVLVEVLCQVLGGLLAQRTGPNATLKPVLSTGTGSSS